MNSADLISKGCFAFPKNKKGKDRLGQYPKEPWYKAYRKAWTSFEEKLQEIEHESLKEVFQGVLDYVRDSPNYVNQEDELPSATLLTGVNMTDHSALFATLTQELKKNVTPHVAVLWAQDCNNLKATVERLCTQFMTMEGAEEDADENDSDSEVTAVNSGLSKAHLTFRVLVRWYKQLKKEGPIYYKTKLLKKSGADKPLVVIISNFECFSHKVLQDFILILSANRKIIPLTLILGVATSVSAVHRSLPHHVSSKLCIQLFHTQPSSAYLNKILDSVILNPERPFHLGSKTFGVLLDVFLFYDFSVSGFIQGFKFCMTEHFYGKPWATLCCKKDDLRQTVNSLSQKELESAMRLPSLRRHIESLGNQERTIAWFQNEKFAKGEILRFLSSLHDICSTFYSALRVLQILCDGLPESPLGKNFRNMYADAISTNITSVAAFQNCMKLLEYQAKNELINKLEKVLAMFSKDVEVSQLSIFADDVSELIDKLKNLDSTRSLSKSPYKSGLRSPTKSPLKSPVKTPIAPKNRAQLKQNILASASKQKSQLSPYEEVRNEVLDYLRKFWEEALVPPTTFVLHEVMFFDDLPAVRSNIIGSPRLAVHTALNDPHHYLQCDCCQLSVKSDILPSLPDLSIVYKLHLESGRHINMYDWLQSYLTIVDPNDNGSEPGEVDPKLQARFTRAVAELQLLGYIKSSNRKADHVTRLTWA